MDKKPSYFSKYCIEVAKSVGFTIHYCDEEDLDVTMFKYSANFASQNPNINTKILTNSYYFIVINQIANKMKELNIQLYNKFILDEEIRKKPKIALKFEDSRKAKTIPSFKEQDLSYSKLPKCFSSFKEYRKALRIQGFMTFDSEGLKINELGNIHPVLLPLRQALYSKLNILEFYEEYVVYNETKSSYAFQCRVANADDTNKAWLGWSVEKIIKFLFHNLEKSSNVVFSEYSRHLFVIFATVCDILSSANDTDFLELMEKYISKIKPVAKIVIDKKCSKCTKHFKVNENEIEKYILYKWKYPVWCQECIKMWQLEQEKKKFFEDQLRDAVEKEEKIAKEEENKKLRKEEEDRDAKEREDKNKNKYNSGSSYNNNSGGYNNSSSNNNYNYSSSNNNQQTSSNNVPFVRGVTKPTEPARTNPTTTSNTNNSNNVSSNSSFCRAKPSTTSSSNVTDSSNNNNSNSSSTIGFNRAVKPSTTIPTSSHNNTNSSSTSSTGFSRAKK